MKNVIAFKEARDAAGLHFPRIMITCTVMNEFMEEVHGVVAHAAKLDGMFRYWPLVGSGLHGGESWVTPFHGTTSNFNYDEQIPRDGRRWHAMAQRIAAEAERLGVTVVDAFQYSWGGEEDGAFAPINKEGVKDCPLIHRQHFFNANGNAQMCCVQTAPLFNWREVGPMNFDRHPAVIEARSDAIRGIIPKGCSGASCSYIAGSLPLLRQPSRLPILRESSFEWIRRHEASEATDRTGRLSSQLTASRRRCRGRAAQFRGNLVFD
ncbi:hypothetical protein IC580_05505 [Cupriavidus sp. ISTL7]|nr:hypothetical protein IC580_05505 [Cupriavidus sp. ISTL7]